MTFEPKFSVITACVGNLGDRFLTSGYKERVCLEDRLKRIAGIEGITGVELCYDPGGEEGNAALVRKLLAVHRLQAPVVNAPLVGDKRWSFGTFSAPDGAVRREAVETAKRTIDFAEATGAGLINLWLGQDGFDYPFQADYAEQWQNMVEGVRACAEYKPSIRLALEFKPREPRNRALIDSASTSLLLVREIDRPNVGVTIDNGHVLQVGANMAQAVALCSRAGRLFNMHLNDNYAGWDDDMIAGSVHLVEYLELLYTLRKTSYGGWCSIDIFPYRENAERATEESVAFLAACNRWVAKVGMEKIHSLIAAGDVTEMLRTIRTSLLC
ncbi:MAG TPA: sugar phosphate isomerase/epimerase family protein [Spirochaetia bacterium]|nr:sugar phosphate isomerase/epimerase family protein [Spirochaetia bacterium]